MGDIIIDVIEDAAALVRSLDKLIALESDPAKLTHLKRVRGSVATLANLQDN